MTRLNPYGEIIEEDQEDHQNDKTKDKKVVFAPDQPDQADQEFTPNPSFQPFEPSPRPQPQPPFAAPPAPPLPMPDQRTNVLLLVISGVFFLAVLITLFAIVLLINRDPVAEEDPGISPRPVFLIVTATPEVGTVMPVEPSGRTETPVSKKTPVPEEIPVRIEPSSVDEVIELSVLEGHTDHVVRVAIAPDSKTIASASGDNTIKVWNATTDVLQYTLMEHTDFVRGVAWSPDGQSLASASRDKTVRLWNVDDGTLLFTFPQHTEEVWSVAWAPDGETLASAACASRDDDNCHAGEILLWRKDGTVLHQLHDMETETVGGVSVAFAPDGQTLAVASKDTTVWLWNVSDGTLQERLTGHTDFVWDVAWSSNSETLASVSRDQTVRLWNIGTSSVRTLKGHTDFVWGVAWHPDDEILASASKDQTIRLWDADDGKALRTLEGHTDGVVSLTFTPDGQRLVSTARDGTVRLWGIP